jgi:hypothetical protein
MVTAYLDDKLADELSRATQRVAIRNRAGRIVGFFEPVATAPRGVAKALSPISDEELRERMKDKGGSLPLAEVLRRIGAE